MIVLRHTEQTRPIYDQIYSGTAIDQMDSMFLWIQSLLGLTPGDRFLDISTGRGQMVKLAGQRGIDAVGIDFSLRACQITHDKKPNSAICADAQRLPFADNSFDAAANIGSLEHVELMEVAVREMARVLTPGGRACLTVPNTFGLLWNVSAGWRTGDIDDDGQPLQRYGTRCQWERLLLQNGLRVERVLGYEHEHAFPRTRKDLTRYWFHPKRIAIMSLGRLIPVNAAGQLVFVCTKA